MKKKLYYLLLMALLVSCGSKENSEDPIDPNSPSQKILGNWRQYRSVQYREGTNLRDTSINEYSPPRYYRFTKEQCIDGYERDGGVVFENYGNSYQIKGDSMFSPHYGRMIFAGDSLKIESRTATAVDIYIVNVLYRY